MTDRPMPKCPWCNTPYDEPEITPAKYTVAGEERYWGHMTCSNPECGSHSPLVYGKHPEDVAKEAIAAALRRPMQKQGLYGKYTVIKNETGETVGDCFVLRPMKDEAAVKSLQAYAAATDDAQLRDDLYAWVGKPMQKPLTFDELNALPDGVWYENDTVIEPMMISHEQIFSLVYNKNVVIGLCRGRVLNYFKQFELPVAWYGKTWRCWAQKPTDEERAAAKWEE